jgi:hypothetical protein
MKTVSRYLLFVLLARIPLCPETGRPCPIQILVGTHKSVTVTFPCMDRAQIVDLVSDFLARGDEAAKERFQNLLKDSGDITMKMTTERPQ